MGFYLLHLVQTKCVDIHVPNFVGKEFALFLEGWNIRIYQSPFLTTFMFTMLKATWVSPSCNSFAARVAHRFCLSIFKPLLHFEWFNLQYTPSLTFDTLHVTGNAGQVLTRVVWQANSKPNRQHRFGSVQRAGQRCFTLAVADARIYFWDSRLEHELNKQLSRLLTLRSARRSY